VNCAREESHLYPGFRFVGALSSIGVQRDIQGLILQALGPRRLFVVGCGYGEELATLLGEIVTRGLPVRVTAIDLLLVEERLNSHDFARRLGSRFKFFQLDLMDAPSMPGYGQFDVVQCGFVLHDITYPEKDRALKTLAESVRPSGYVVVSDIFCWKNNHNLAEVADIYDTFLYEAHFALGCGMLQRQQWQSLLGDGSGPGLLSTKAEAASGSRDYFETLDRMVDRAADCDLEICSIESNPVNPWLRVLVMRRKPATASRCPRGSGACFPIVTNCVGMS
jgi:SAM-dependent methyltransferase